MQTHNMAGSSEPRVVEAERTASGILITFQNGEAALYSPRLLWSMFEMAEKLPEDIPEDDSLQRGSKSRQSSSS
jgi:hypothetical protein